MTKLVSNLPANRTKLNCARWRFDRRETSWLKKLRCGSVLNERTVDVRTTADIHICQTEPSRRVGRLRHSDRGGCMFNAPATPGGPSLSPHVRDWCNARRMGRR